MRLDDQTGLTTGGNTTRKLVSVVATALAQGLDGPVALGAGQSNHDPQRAPAAGFGLHYVRVLVGDLSSRG